jgi:hypothetical protein
MLEGLGITGVLIPYAVLACAISAVVLGLREGIPTLKKSKPLSTIAPLVLGAVGGYLFPELHPKGTTHLMGTMYGLLAGSFSAPIYHAIRRLVAARLKGDSKNPKGGEEMTFSGDMSAVHIKAIKKPEPPKPPPLTKDENE